MAVGVRRRRRRAAWPIFGLLLSLMVLGLNAAISARSKEPTRKLEELAYLDQVRPLIQRSNDQAGDLADIRETASELGRAGIGRRLDRLSRETMAVERALKRLEPPVRLAGEHTLLEATFVIRARAAGRVGTSLVAALGTKPPEAAINGLAQAGEDLVASDRTYGVFTSGLPKIPGAPKLPASAWVPDPESWTQPVVSVFVAALRASATLAPVHDLAVVLARTDPAPVGTENGLSVLPPLKSLHVDVIVANVGNETEKRVMVLGTVSAPDGTVDTARQFVTLTPGQRVTVGLGLKPPTNANIVVLRIGPVEGEIAQADNEKLIPIIMR